MSRTTLRSVITLNLKNPTVRAIWEKFGRHFRMDVDVGRLIQLPVAFAKFHS
jgi:hypothetical protein